MNATTRNEPFTREDMGMGIVLLAMIWSVAETAYFNSPFWPQTPAEVICDAIGFCGVLTGIWVMVGRWDWRAAAGPILRFIGIFLYLRGVRIEYGQPVADIMASRILLTVTHRDTNPGLN